MNNLIFRKWNNFASKLHFLHEHIVNNMRSQICGEIDDWALIYGNNSKLNDFLAWGSLDQPEYFPLCSNNRRGLIKMPCWLIVK